MDRGCAPTTAAGIRDTICQDGVFNAGVKSDSAPFGFIDENGTQVGFDVDIVREITKDLSAYCKKPVRLVLKTVTDSNRIPFVQNGTVDLAAATATITYARLDVVDFSNPYFVDGVRILVPAGSDLTLHRPKDRGFLPSCRRLHAWTARVTPGDESAVPG